MSYLLSSNTAMLSSVILIFGFLLLKVCAQELGDTGTQQSTDLPSQAQDIDWDTTGSQLTPTDNFQFRKAGRLQSLNHPRFGPMFLPLPPQPFGARIQQENDTFPEFRFYPGSDGPPDRYSVNWTEGGDSYPQPSEYMRYAPNGLSPVMYYPPPINSGTFGSIRYSLQGDPIGDIPSSTFQDFSERINVSIPQQTIFPEYPPARTYRRDRFPVHIRNLPNPNFFIRNDNGERNPGNTIPFVPYPFPPVFLPPSSDEERVDIFVRPPYGDRELGSDALESNLPTKEVPAEQPVPPVEPASTEVPAPAELVPSRFIPRRPLPLGSFPFGIPRPELLPPFPFPAVAVPPTIPPPVFPSLPVPSDENLLGSVLSHPPPVPEQPPVFEVGPQELSPPENIPTEVSEIDAGQVNKDVEDGTKIPYEFGYEMNDGLGTDQHRKEVSDGSGGVTGSYGYKDPFGVYRLVNYIADKNGFRAFIHSNEPGIANPGSADVTVIAERPPPSALAEGLRTLKLDTVEVPDETIQPEIVGSEKK